MRVPSEGPFPRPWLPRDIPLTRVAEPRPQEVQPPVAISSRELLAPLKEVIPPAAAKDAETPVPVEVLVPPASALAVSSPGAEAVSSTAADEGVVGGDKPILTFGRITGALRPYWLSGCAKIPEVAEVLLASTESTLCLEDIILTAEAMTAQHQDMALLLHRWLRDRSGPEHDARAILAELLNLFSTLKDVE